MNRILSIFRNLVFKITFITLLFFVRNVSAFDLVTADVINGYSNCYITDNKDTTSTAFITIDYKSTDGRLGGMKFYSRGLMFYSYNSSGVPSNNTAMLVKLGDVITANAFRGNGYVMYYSGNNYDPGPYPWSATGPFSAVAEVIFQNKLLDAWGAVAIRAGNFTSGDDVGEKSGAAYISVGNGADYRSSCKIIIDPIHPPEPDIEIVVTAPDWELGEIKSGNQSIPFNNSRDWLCLKYSDITVAKKQFIMTASSHNGEVGNQYQLKNQDDASQSIPYHLILDSGSQQLIMPSVTNKSLPLEMGGKTCFMPIFKTAAPKDIEKGDYSDVLTFNIAIQS